MDFGARGNGKFDDSHAFLSAWHTTCRTSGTTTLVIPAGKTFLVTNTVTLTGPCMSTRINIEIQGEIVAPSFDEWGPADKSKWISIYYVNHLTINGAGGKIDGLGFTWWERCRNCFRPRTLSFHGCNDLTVSHLHLVNSPGGHIALDGSIGASFSHIHIQAPANSPNTDGFDIANSRNILIRNSNIEAGDDCIAINGGTSFINVTRVACGPGHGISIGSLGRGGAHEIVEEVYVYDCIFTGTSNAARIKTVSGGSGYARKITFEKITLIRAGNPIIIDQHYGLNPTADTSVVVSDVTYRGIHGTSTADLAIKLDCSTSGCFNIVLDQINIVSAIPGRKTYASCHNAHGTVRSSIPSVPCLLR
ncbi:probable polygalacturonase At3g15720 [Lotus japonicus]|uniref:probable polygalacturonase At3g15720 n=1 Tax=Lotus japonicus TaxID=34305 RepID=UPI00258C9C33|nr:probable polygalacturonase At3g15720 [Lotus japonicus]